MTEAARKQPKQGRILSGPCQRHERQQERLEDGAARPGLHPSALYAAEPTNIANLPKGIVIVREEFEFWLKKHDWIWY